MMDRHDFQSMVKEDTGRMRGTVGTDGTVWMLQKKEFSEKRLSDKEYRKTVEYDKDSLIRWIIGTEGSKKHAWQTPRGIDLDHLLRLSNERHRLLCGNSVSDEYLLNRDKRNVYDFFYTNVVRHSSRTVADIGAGYARNSFLFVENGFNYICVDAVERCYVMQSNVLNELFGSRLVDYWNNRELTQRDIASLLEEGQKQEPIVIHIPTWRLDLIPDACVDVSMFVFSLEEMPTKAARYCLDSALRFTSEQGILYLRGDFFRRINYLNPKIFAEFNGLYQVLDLTNMYPEDAYGQTYLFRKDNRSTKQKLRDFLYPWMLYCVHTLLRVISLDR